MAWIYIVTTGGTLVVAAISAWLFARGKTEIPTQAGGRRARVVGYAPLVVALAILVLWALAGWKHQWWWYPLIAGVMFWFLAAQARSLRK